VGFRAQRPSSISWALVLPAALGDSVERAQPLLHQRQGPFRFRIARLQVNLFARQFLRALAQRDGVGIPVPIAQQVRPNSQSGREVAHGERVSGRGAQGGFGRRHTLPRDVRGLLKRSGGSIADREFARNALVVVTQRIVPGRRARKRSRIACDF
jgi:hypothetical protein